MALCAALLSQVAQVDALQEAAAARELATLPPGAELVIAGDDLARFGRPGGPTAHSEIVDAAGQPFTKALRVVVREPGPQRWSAVLTTPRNTIALGRGDILLLSYAVRCTASAAESGGGHVSGYFELAREPWTGTGQFSASPGREWQRRYARTTAERDFAPGELHVALHLAQYAQTLELGGLTLYRLPAGTDPKLLPASPITYAGREPDAPWRTEAAARIEAHRKGDLRIRALDGAGDLIAGATVHVRMTRHAYEFGTFLEGPTLWDNADGERYRQTVLELFNRVTCPLYWADWGWWSEERKSEYLALARWARDHDFRIRGHNLIWPSWRWTPTSLRELADDRPALDAAIRASIVERVAAFAPFELDDYDVVNELRDNHEIVDILGPECVAEWFRLVRATDPRPRLGVNDFAILTMGGNTEANQDTYLHQIRNLQAEGAPIEVVGFQCHFGEDLTSPERVVRILDRFAETGLELQATELDISTDDEAAQADYLRDFLTVFFSHPATTAVTQWGFWEGQHWIPRAALFRRDWSPKPSGQAYRDLVLGEWWTRAEGATDAAGDFRTRGFLGEYEVTVTHEGASVTTRCTLPREGLTIEVSLP